MGRVLQYKYLVSVGIEMKNVTIIFVLIMILDWYWFNTIGVLVITIFLSTKWKVNGEVKIIWIFTHKLIVPF